jgi:hypothetical protein
MIVLWLEIQFVPVSIKLMTGIVRDYSASPTIANAPPNLSCRPSGSIRRSAGPPRRERAAIRKAWRQKFTTLLENQLEFRNVFQYLEKSNHLKRAGVRLRCA